MIVFSPSLINFSVLSQGFNAHFCNSKQRVSMIIFFSIFQKANWNDQLNRSSENRLKNLLYVPDLNWKSINEKNLHHHLKFKFLIRTFKTIYFSEEVFLQFDKLKSKWKNLITLFPSSGYDISPPKLLEQKCVPH